LRTPLGGLGLQGGLVAQALRQGADLAHGHQGAVEGSVGQEFAVAAAAGEGDDRQAAGEGLEHHRGEGVFPGTEQEEVGGLVIAADLGGEGDLVQVAGQGWGLALPLQAGPEAGFDLAEPQEVEARYRRRPSGARRRERGRSLCGRRHSQH
jgi:hypothetical protein